MEQVAGIAIKTPLSYEGQLAEVQFKFCAPDALDVTSLTEEEVGCVCVCPCPCPCVRAEEEGCVCVGLP
jgi:hypothetical protein